MKQSKVIELDFEVDKLTNSIENAVSGEVFDTLVTPYFDQPTASKSKKLNGHLIGKPNLKIKPGKSIN